MFEELKSRHLFTMRMKADRQMLGTTQYGSRWITLVTSAEIEGAGIRARLLPGASDWISATPDGVIRLDCRMAFETDDGATIAMTYRGMRHGPAELLERQSKGEEIDPELIYHRVAIFFETSAPRPCGRNPSHAKLSDSQHRRRVIPDVPAVTGAGDDADRNDGGAMDLGGGPLPPGVSQAR
jgi:hypothetical protein